VSRSAAWLLLIAIDNLLGGHVALAQTTAEPQVAPPVEQLDLVDVARWLLRRPPVEPPQAGEDRRVSIFPTLTGSPGVGVALGAQVSIAERVGDKTVGSLLTISGSYSTEGQLQLTSRADQRSENGEWRLIGDWRFWDFTERTYGLGSDTSPDTWSDVKYQWARVYATVYRQVIDDLAVGGGYHLDVRGFDEFQLGGGAPVQDPEGRLSSGVSLNAIYDSRDNLINASRGWLGRASYVWFPRALGSDRGWQTAQVEARVFRQLSSSRRQVLALWAFGWFTNGQPPYLDLPSIGWDTYRRTGRGYTAGRFRGRDWLYGEAEYRTDLLSSGLLGFVTFVNASTFSDAGERYGAWNPAGGLGMRVKLDKRHGSNLAVDVGWGRDGSYGVYAALNEAF
jgi:hypothetical protein